MGRIKIDWEIPPTATYFDKTNHTANYFGVPILLIFTFIAETFLLIWISWLFYIAICFIQYVVYRWLIKRKLKPTKLFLYFSERKSNNRRALAKRYANQLKTRDTILKKELLK